MDGRTDGQKDRQRNRQASRQAIERLTLSNALHGLLYPGQRTVEMSSVVGLNKVYLHSVLLLSSCATDRRHVQCCCYHHVQRTVEMSSVVVITMCNGPLKCPVLLSPCATDPRKCPVLLLLSSPCVEAVEMCDASSTGCQSSVTFSSPTRVGAVCSLSRD